MVDWYRNCFEPTESMRIIVSCMTNNSRATYRTAMFNQYNELFYYTIQIVCFSKQESHNLS